jgi:hypothetical protein
VSEISSTPCFEASFRCGRVEMVLKPQESQYNPIVSVHGGIIATVLDSVMGCAVRQAPGWTGVHLAEDQGKLPPGRQSRDGADDGGQARHPPGSPDGDGGSEPVDASGKLFAQASATCLIVDVPAVRVS